MALKIKWSKKADESFDKILEYLQEKWGEKITRSFVQRVYGFLDLASEFPEIGSIEHPELGIRGFVLNKQVTLFYKVKNNAVVLLNFYDNRQNPEKGKV